MPIQYVASSCYNNAPISYETPTAEGVSLGAYGVAGAVPNVVSTLVGGTPAGMNRNYHLPQAKPFFAVTAPAAVTLGAGYVTPSPAQYNVLGHKWQTYTPGGPPTAAPTYQADGGGLIQRAHAPISGVVMSPMYACNDIVPFGPLIGVPATSRMRTSGFLVSDRPRLDFAADMVANATIPASASGVVTGVTKVPTLPGFYWMANDTTAAANTDITSPPLGMNRYSFLLSNPVSGIRFNDAWRAPFAVGSVDTQNHNGPYSFPQFGLGAGQVQYRLVSAELRIKYTGTEEDRGGLVTSLEHPEHQSLVGFTLAQLQAYDACRTEAVMANKWHSCLYSGPISDTETEFSPTPLVTPFMTIVVSGGTNLSFQVEGWANYEFAGDLVRNKISVCADEQGGVAVATACKVLQTKKAFGGGQAKAVLREAQRQIAAGSGVSFLSLFFFVLTHQ